MEQVKMLMAFLDVFLMNLFPSYRVDFPIQKFPEAFSCTVYEKGRSTTTKTIDANDASYLKLKAQLLNERGGWRHDLISYAPQKLCSAPTMTINCIGRLMAINYEARPGLWMQISKGQLREACPSL